MKAWRWNGAAFETCDSVPVSDRGFRYGMSLFESMPLTSSGPEHFDAHIERLREACTARAFALDESACLAAGDLLAHSAQHGFARIYVTAGDGASTAAADSPRIFVFVEPRDLPALRPYAIQIRDDLFHPPFGGLKTGNYWANVEALRRAEMRGRQEALLFNERAELVSACCANVFLVRGGAIWTPAIACGARRGVMRELVMRALAAQHITVLEGSLFVGDVLAADELFLTSSWIGVMPVASVNDRPLPSHSLASALREQRLFSRA